MKKKGKGKSYLRFRIYFILGVFIFSFCVIFARAFELQVLEGKHLKYLAGRQHRKIVNIQSKRGAIYDRNLKELAVSLDVDSVYVQPQKVASPGEAAGRLARLLSMNVPELGRKLRSDENFVWLKRQVDLTEGERKAVEEIDGAGIVKESRRYYPNRALASNLMGFTGVDSRGLEGVELFYDRMLRGEPVRLASDKDATGRLILYGEIDGPAHGMAVELTIDKTIQYIAEKALKKKVEDSGARGGAAIVMDPRTGEILAMADVPTFDPNGFRGFSERDWRNRAITDAVEPGSIMKTFLISAALEENAVKTADAFYCEMGSFRVANRVFHDVDKNGWLTVPRILKVSSNIGAAKIGERLGKAGLYRYLRAYGFGEKSGIDLPGESAGILRPTNRWSKVTLETISFGQGVSVTPLQLITAVSAIANGGFLMKPHVVRAVLDHDGRVVKEFNPVIRRRVISQNTAKKMTDMLIGVTQPGGTGVKAAIDGFEVAGKTGTAQKPDLVSGGYMKRAFTSSFFGFVPARDPRLAIIVMIDEPKSAYHGGEAAAPVFKEIAAEGLSHIDVFPDISPGAEMSAAKADPAPENAAAGAESDAGPGVPDFTGRSVRMVMRMAREKSLGVDIIGSGRAYGQKPAPGSVPANGSVTVWFR